MASKGSSTSRNKSSEVPSTPSSTSRTPAASDSSPTAVPHRSLSISHFLFSDQAPRNDDDEHAEPPTPRPTQVAHHIHVPVDTEPQTPRPTPKSKGKHRETPQALPRTSSGSNQASLNISSGQALITGQPRSGPPNFLAPGTMSTVPYPAPVAPLPGGAGSPYDHIVDLIKIIKQTARTIPRAVASFRAQIRCPHCAVKFHVMFSTTVDVPTPSTTQNTPNAPNTTAAPAAPQEASPNQPTAGPSASVCRGCNHPLPQKH